MGTVGAENRLGGRGQRGIHWDKCNSIPIKNFIKKNTNYMYWVISLKVCKKIWKKDAKMLLWLLLGRGIAGD